MTCRLRLLPFACVLAAVPLAAIGAAYAQVLPPEANNPAVRAAISACTIDAKKLCADVVPGGGRIVRCLVDRQGDLTPACRDSILKAKTALGR